MNEIFDSEKILKRALSKGGEFADIYFESSRFTSIAMENGQIERVFTGIDSGTGLRVIAGLRTFYGWSNDSSDKSLLKLAENLAEAVSADSHDQPLLSINLPKDVREPHISANDSCNVTLEQKNSLVKTAYSYARSLNDSVTQLLLVYRDSTAFCRYAASDGAYREWERIGTVFSAQATASSGSVIQTGYESAGGAVGFQMFDSSPAEQIAEKAVKRAVMMLSANRAKGGMMPVVLSSEAGGTMVHEAIGHGLEGDLVNQGMSVYRGKIGEIVASPLVSVADDPTIPFARGSYQFDDEGVQSKRNLLVENGRLKSFMYDRLTAMKEGVASTGNGRRESYQAKPIVRMSNTMILPGESLPNEIISSVSNGLFVKRMGGGQVNTVNGDFVFEVSEGYLIENGEITAPIRGGTLTGNGPEVLKNICMVGNDLGFGIGTCGKDGQGVPVADAQPTLLIDRITVGGAV